jgi:hypothetical protein
VKGKCSLSLCGGLGHAPSGAIGRPNGFGPDREFKSARMAGSAPECAWRYCKNCRLDWPLETQLASGDWQLETTKSAARTKKSPGESSELFPLVQRRSTNAR